MKKGDIIELRTIDKKGFIHLDHKKVNDPKAAEQLLKANDYSQMPAEPHAWICSHQYEV